MTLNFLDLVDDLEHVSALNAFAQAKSIVYNESALNHGYLEDEINQFTDAINAAVIRFQTQLSGYRLARLDELLASDSRVHEYAKDFNPSRNRDVQGCKGHRYDT